ncbi:unnamed protein product [Orchesella dallaii]|uniref:Uncharacterized protein n=1 Tax=Orchesella dallaii TaxID=48710 RepID=A0ABP1PQG1_9HEXA
MTFSLSQQCLAVTIVLLGVYTGITETTCDFDRSCLHIYNNLKGIYEEQDINDWNTICALSQDLKDCMKKTSRRCRGDLNYHFFEKLVKDLNSHIQVGSHCTGGLPKGSSGEGLARARPSSRPDRNHPHRHSGSTRRTQSDRCAPKIPADSPTVGCALFGLTNLKSFSEPLNYTDINYCSLAGAWSLVDTPEFAVQITNKGGLSPLPRDITATTLVTVIIKNSHCSERKTYQATFDEIPGMFSDGYTTAGSVYIETIRESEHVKIHLPYLLTTIDVIKVIDKLPIPSLSVAIKMPQVTVENLMSEPKRIRGLPLCYYGCPRAAANRQRSTDGVVGRSNNGGGSYYKSHCPAFPPPIEESEVPPSPSSSSLASSSEDIQSDSVQPQDFSSSLSAEFLQEDDEEESDEGDDSSPESSSIPLASDVIAGNTRRRHRASSHESNGGTTAVICASLNSVHRVLADSTVVSHKLRLPGEDNFSSSPSSSTNGDSSLMSSDANFAHVMNSALTSQSAPMSRYHSAFVYLVVILILVCR